NLFNFGAEEGGPELVASKRVSDRLRVTYTTNVGQLNDNGIRLNYELTDHISLQGKTDQYGNSGLDLKYRIKFK
ncbi:MAG: translocation/assembly module TamB domain-containing protein, partial [Calditrichia bacterium]